MAGALIPAAAAIAGYGGYKSIQNQQNQDANKLASNEAAKMLLGDYGRTQTPTALPKVNIGGDGGVSFAPSAAPQPRPIGGGGLLSQGRTLGLLSSAVGPQAMLQAVAPSMLSKMFPAAPPAYQKMSPGDVVQQFNPATGKYDTIGNAPFAPKEGFKIGATREVQRGTSKVTQEFDGTSFKDIGSGPAFAPDKPSWGNPVDEIGPSGKPVRVQYDNNGNRREIQGAQPYEKPEARWDLIDHPQLGKVLRNSSNGDLKPAPQGGSKYNNEQLLSANFANRMALSNSDLQKIATDYPDFSPTSYTEAAKAVTNKTMTTPNQLYRQAQSNWVSANLRRESGAAIGVDEMANEVKKYFPQAGDSNELIAQKARSRAAAEQGMQFNSGGAYEALAGKSLAPGGGSGGPPPEAVAALKSNPMLRMDFDKKYGPGASKRYLSDGNG